LPEETQEKPRDTSVRTAGFATAIRTATLLNVTMGALLDRRKINKENMAHAFIHWFV
jgi:hypothetical protein